MMVKRLMLTCVLLTASSGLPAADVIESKTIHFAKGTSSAKVEGSLKGDLIVDYKLAARAAQTVSVLLETSNLANYFNVLPPGSRDVAIFTGSINGNDWTGQLPADGEYTVHVYLMRSAARRNEVANYTLNVSITDQPDSAAGVARDGDAKVKGTPYHATGQVPCSLGDVP